MVNRLLSERSGLYANDQENKTAWCTTEKSCFSFVFIIDIMTYCNSCLSWDATPYFPAPVVFCNYSSISLILGTSPQQGHSNISNSWKTGVCNGRWYVAQFSGPVDWVAYSITSPTPGQLRHWVAVPTLIPRLFQPSLPGCSNPHFQAVPSLTPRLFPPSFPGCS